jgi:hypothetical protein
MKQEIKDLSNQAKKYAFHKTGSLNSTESFEIFEQKFAELVAQRCANLVWDEAEKTMNKEVNDAGYKIIHHFFEEPK